MSQPKTENSIRQISIPKDTVDMLIAEHEKHPDNPYLFPSSKTGGMYYPDSVVLLHRRVLKRARLPHIRFHDLRHTFATMALQNGVDAKTLSCMLGHYDAGFTLRTYTHATRQMQGRREDGKLHGADQVKRNTRKQHRKGSQLPFRCCFGLSERFGLWGTVWGRTFSHPKN